MRISGFTFVRNALDLGYPVVESIASVLPLCDEFVVAAGDSSDETTALLRTMGPKVRVIETRWDPALFTGGAVFAQQTDVALAACTGDWAFYIQADEVLHEQDYPMIEARLHRHLGDERVEGLLFDYLHFFGDHQHVQTSHNWYRHEIRVVRTGIGVASWGDAQGFRIGKRKLHVAHADATVYHYGHARPPRRMQLKERAFNAAYAGVEAAAWPVDEGELRYGLLSGLRRFEGTHPAVMQERVAQQDWSVTASGPAGHKQDRLRVRVATWLENTLLGFRIGERKNYVLLPDLGPERELPFPAVKPA